MGVMLVTGVGRRGGSILRLGLTRLPDFSGIALPTANAAHLIISLAPVARSLGLPAVILTQGGMVVLHRDRYIGPGLSLGERLG
ncbi:hypothetical protein C2846_16295 [Pseudomonas jilinensis]|uniref:Uncharacterized protein n=1 Tax=Pseudomonas jilinensis TaxID=2078689 RepID=A0A396RZQ6_9PSED|nr:hypothetical protein C2846_16295 [Pseudomonas jilinensis]